MSERISNEKIQAYFDSPTTHIPDLNGLVLDLKDARAEIERLKAERDAALYGASADPALRLKSALHTIDELRAENAELKKRLTGSEEFTKLVDELYKAYPTSQIARDMWRKVCDHEAALRAKLAEAEECNRKTVCTYCGHVETCDSFEERTEIMAQHIYNCERHPMNRVAEIVEQQTAEIQAKLAASERARKRLERAYAELYGIAESCPNCVGSTHCADAILNESEDENTNK